MIARQTTLTPGTILRGHLVVTDPAFDELQTIDGEVWQRSDQRKSQWQRGYRWKQDEWAVMQIQRGAYIRRRPRD